MCGIFAYIGNSKSASKTVLDGLKVLEYRGYDSWGVVAKKNGKIIVQKKVGKIGIATLTDDLSDTKISIAAGHTRWATHGGVTQKNAHPHMDCNKKIAVVHNGIVENYKALKNTLIKQGHTFLSDTDTEVLPHLIEQQMKSYSFEDAVFHAFNMCQGLSAIVVINSESDTIVAAKTGSPLIVGKNDNEIFLASDASALSFANKALYLDDFQMAVLTFHTVELYSLKTHKKIDFSWEELSVTKQKDDLGSYQHFMIKEIFEQPEVVKQALQDQKNIEKLAKLLKTHKKVFFIAAGTAYHAALAGVYMLSRVGVLPRLVVASEFEYVESEIDAQSLVVAFSQSGETIDVIEPLGRAREKGAVIASVINSKGSTIQRMSDVSVLLFAGAEKAVASTKAYTAKLSVLLNLLFLLQGKNDIQLLAHKIAAEEKRLLEKDSIKSIKTLAKQLKDVPYMFSIGRKLSYQSALEAALKIKEVSYVHIEGLAGGELKHGSIALIQKGTPCIVFAPKDETHSSIMSNAMEIKARGGYIIGISPESSEVFDYFIEVKDLGLGSVLAQVIPVQLLAYYLALEKGITDPDKPRNLAKSVTVK